MNETLLAAMQISAMMLVSVGIGIGFTRWFWLDKTSQSNSQLAEMEKVALLARRQRDEVQRTLKEEQLKWSRRQQEVDFTIRSLEKERALAFQEKDSQKQKMEEEVKRLKLGLDNLKDQTKKLNDLHREELAKKSIEIKKLSAALTLSEQARQEDIMDKQRMLNEIRPPIS